MVEKTVQGLLCRSFGQHAADMTTVLAAFGASIFVAIAMASILAVGVVIERLRRLMPWRQQFAETLACLESGADALAAHLATGKDGERDPLTRCLGRGFAARERGREAVRLAALESGQQAVTALERGLGVVMTVAQITPLLGLLGTVAGLMQAFQAASQAEQITTGLLAGGMYQALGTTAAGLGVAIPAWIAFNALDGWVSRMTVQLEIAIAELPDVALGKAKAVDRSS